MEEITYFIAQWRDSSGVWRESSGFGRDDENQQAYYAERFHIDTPYSTDGAQAFARVLCDAGKIVRIIRRIENETTLEF